MEKKTDKKFIVGMVLLVGMILLLMGGFWSTVIRQAKIDAIQEQQEEQMARRAICLQYGEEMKAAVFWDMDEAICFTADTPAGIYNRNDVFVRGDVLEYGDMVRIYGGELVEAEFPPSLTGLKKMERLGRATLEEASAYQEELDAALAAAAGDA